MIKINKLVQNNAQGQLFTTDLLKAQAGEVVGIIGPNGAGKTTLLQKIQAARQPEVLVEGRVGYVQQLDSDYQDMSGGQAMQMRLQQVLIDRPDVLLLDEPTSNLDFKHQQKLIQILRRFKGITLVVSHDEDFLQQVADQLWAFENGQVAAQKIDFATYQKQRAVQQAKQLKKAGEERRQQKKLQFEAQKLVQAGDRVKRNNNTLKGDTVQAQLTGNARVLRQKAATVRKTERPKQGKPLKLQMQQQTRPNQVMTRVTQTPLFAPDGNQLVAEVNMTIQGHDKLMLTGANGVGKTTLLQLLMTAAQQHTHTQIGYFDQRLNNLNLKQTALQNVLEHSMESEQTARDFLGAFGLRREQVHQMVGHMSGGERVRVSLVAALLTQANWLVLDEPTNYLDEPALLALQDFLENYVGAITLVTHDQVFLQRLSMMHQSWQLWKMEPGLITLENSI
ncbi:hypothetical protein IV73_GL001161 [Weissella kandleri]|uniref:ABC transporter domain-containing protein n=1 Tax=Weissella kandleri TaxID=1616 RepID=A0A0R2JBX8_9LACO|nr:ATP-binding cassette domain-containing protein [Weissella kandleri]KRN74753.1 hypothetical protein IV73_GL001161 [Weissella kandleri]